MFTFAYACPHCHTERAYFEVGAAAPYRDDSRLNRLSLLAQCHCCHNSMCCDVDFGNMGQGEMKKFLERCTDRVPINLFEYYEPARFRFLPEAAKPDVPENLPDHVRRDFQAAEQLFFISRANEDMLLSAGHRYRLALENALAVLDGGNGQNLNRRINQLVSEGRLVQDMGRFAHRIRALGNDAAHGNEFTLGELGQLRLFARLFLLYTFSLPALIPLSD